MDMVACTITVAPEHLIPMREHYRENLGFEEEFFTSREDGSGMGLFSYGPSSFYIGTPGFVGLLPMLETKSMMAMIRVPHVESLREVIMSRSSDGVGELEESALMGVQKDDLEERMRGVSSAPSSDSVGTAKFFDVLDPTGQTIRFVTLPDTDSNEPI
jgi:hypothetical protein